MINDNSIHHNDKGEKTGVIIPLMEYENLIHQHHLDLELTDQYKSMTDDMLHKEVDGRAKYVSSRILKIGLLENERLT